MSDIQNINYQFLYCRIFEILTSNFYGVECSKYRPATLSSKRVKFTWSLSDERTMDIVELNWDLLITVFNRSRCVEWTMKLHNGLPKECASIVMYHVTFVLENWTRNANASNEKPIVLENPIKSWRGWEIIPRRDWIIV